MHMLGDWAMNTSVLAQVSLVEGFEAYVTSTEFLAPLASIISNFLTALVTALLGPIFGVAG